MIDPINDPNPHDNNAFDTQSQESSVFQQILVKTESTVSSLASDDNLTSSDSTSDSASLILEQKNQENQENPVDVQKTDLSNDRLTMSKRKQMQKNRDLQMGSQVLTAKQSYYAASQIDSVASKDGSEAFRDRYKKWNNKMSKKQKKLNQDQNLKDDNGGQISSYRIYYIGLFLVLSLLFVWIGFIFHLINITPWSILQIKSNDDLTDNDVRNIPEVINAVNSSLACSIFGLICSIILPFLVGLYVSFVQCNGLLNTTNFKIVLDAIYLISLVVSLGLEIFYMVIFDKYAEDLRIDQGAFEFIAGWVSIGLYGLGLVFGLVYLGLLIYKIKGDF